MLAAAATMALLPSLASGRGQARAAPPIPVNIKLLQGSQKPSEGETNIYGAIVNGPCASGVTYQWTLSPSDPSSAEFVPNPPDDPNGAGTGVSVAVSFYVANTYTLTVTVSKPGCMSGSGFASQSITVALVNAGSLLGYFTTKVVDVPPADKSTPAQPGQLSYGLKYVTLTH